MHQSYILSELEYARKWLRVVQTSSWFLHDILFKEPAGRAQHELIIIDLLLPIQLQISRDISTNKFIPFPPDQDPEASDPGTKCTGPPDPVPGAPLPAWPMWKLPMAEQPINHGIPLIPPVYIWLVIEKKNKWDAHPKYLQIGPNYDQKYPKVLVPFPNYQHEALYVGYQFFQVRPWDHPDDFAGETH